MARAARHIRCRPLALGLALAVLSAGAWAAVRHAQPSAPSLVVPTCTLHLGKGKPGELLNGSFPLANNGRAPLAFRIEASCGCSELKPRQGQIPPGHTQPIEIGVRLDREGTRRDVRITIHSNDPASPVTTYAAYAECPAPLLVSPSVVDFGRITERSMPSAVLRVKDSEGRPLKASELPRVFASSSLLAIEPGSTTAEGWLLTVRLAKPAPRGYFRSEIRLRLPNEDRTIDIPVRAYVHGPVSVAPPKVFLARDPQTGNLRQATVIVWRPDGEPLGSLVGEHLPAGLAMRELSTSGGNRRRFRLVAEDPSALTSPRFIHLRFERLAEAVTVEVRPPEK